MRICLVVPPGGSGVSALLAAIERHTTDPDVVAVWAGDPGLRPLLPDRVRWIDHGLGEPEGIGWGRLLAGSSPMAYEIVRGCRAVARLLRDELSGVLVVRVGAVAVVGPLVGAVPGAGLTLVERTAGLPPVDGLAPTVHDVVEAGRWGTAALGVGPDAAAALDAIATAVGSLAPSEHPGGALAAAVAAAGTTVRSLRGGIAVGWEPDASGPRPADIEHAAPPAVDPAPPSLLDVDLLDPVEPWRVDFAGRRPRCSLADDPDLLGLVLDTADQWCHVGDALRLVGGVEIDDVVRDLVAAAIDAWRRGDGELPPEPFVGSDAEVRAWLEAPWPPWGPDVGRYWTELWRRRVDLQAAFPHPELADHDAFAAWSARSWHVEGRSPLVRGGAHTDLEPWDDVGREPGGVNLIGYLGFDKSLGDVARRVRDALVAADVPLSALEHHASGSPRRSDAGPFDTELRYDTNLIVLNADQVPRLVAERGEQLTRDRRTIAYWFWDVEHVPPSVVDAARLVDEIWVATEFTGAALRAAVDVPVRVLHVPVPEPEPSGATLADLGVDGEGFTFLVTLDHLSVTERKNPLAAVEAFRRAFPEPSRRQRLIVKTINASHRWVDHDRIRVAATGRPDIVVVDRHLSHADQLALTAGCDCLVSLHRAEGLGLHLIEAMWFGRATIASRYSGNLAFMDDDVAALVDVSMVPVERGEGYFPPEATWAEPDLDQAATWMRRMVEEPELAGRLGLAGRARMEQQPTSTETGRTIARWLCG